MKRFGRNALTAPKRQDFELTVQRGDALQAHQFTVAPQLHVGDLFATVVADEAVQTSAIVRVIRRCLVNDDGVPAQWEPTPLERDAAVADDGDPLITHRPDGALVPWPAEQGELAPVEREAAYRGPDGVIYPLADQDTLNKFLVREAGSSRRRWDHLMLRDDEAIVRIEDLQEIIKWLMGEATDRPSA